MGAHACEYGHPVMRRLPENVYRCPACGSEVLPFYLHDLVRVGTMSAFACSLLSSQ